MVDEDLRESSERDFKAYYIPLDMVNSFRYLEQVLTAADDDWLVVVVNLRKARKIWAWLANIMGWEGASSRVSGMLSK